MNNVKFCIAYSYKGSSTDWHTERYNRFVQDAKGLAEFIQKCNEAPFQYTVEEVYSIEAERLNERYIDTLVWEHQQEVEFAAKVEEAKVKSARAKLNKNLTIEEQQILGIVK